MLNCFGHKLNFSTEFVLGIYVWKNVVYLSGMTLTHRHRNMRQVAVRFLYILLQITEMLFLIVCPWLYTDAMHRAFTHNYDTSVNYQVNFTAIIAFKWRKKVPSRNLSLTKVFLSKYSGSNLKNPSYVLVSKLSEKNDEIDHLRRLQHLHSTFFLFISIQFHA